MAVSPEKISEILNFHTTRRKGNGDVDLGSFDGKTRVVYGLRAFEERLIVDPNEPKTGRLRRQPVVLLKTREGEYSLPYAADVARLPENVIKQVADHLRSIREGSRVTHDWPEDY